MDLSAKDVVSLLKASGFFIATAESCTGGLIANLLTDIPGSSAVFWGGWITYDNSAKVSELGVPSELIQKHGAVSAEVAKAMAEGGLRAAQTSSIEKIICVSSTGIAGPTGGSAQKPVGLCYIAAAHPDKETQIEELQARPGLNRLANKEYFAQKIFELVRRLLA